MPMFTLPSSLRPAKNKTFAVAGAEHGSVVRISETGDVILDTGSAAWVSLDGITFRAGD